MNLYQALLRTESGSGDPYRTLLSHSQKEGGRFAGTDITSMNAGDLFYNFAAPGGEYGQWTKDQVGRVATPMGLGQIVGQTGRSLIEQGVIDPDKPFDQTQQHNAILALAKQAGRGGLRGTWEGFKNLSDDQLDSVWASIQSGEHGLPSAQPRSALREFADVRGEEGAAIADFLAGFGEGPMSSPLEGPPQPTAPMPTPQEPSILPGSTPLGFGSAGVHPIVGGTVMETAADPMLGQEMPELLRSDTLADRLYGGQGQQGTDELVETLSTRGLSGSVKPTLLPSYDEETEEYYATTPSGIKVPFNEDGTADLSAYRDDRGNYAIPKEVSETLTPSQAPELYFDDMSTEELQRIQGIDPNIHPTVGDTGPNDYVPEQGAAPVLGELPPAPPGVGYPPREWQGPMPAEPIEVGDPNTPREGLSFADRGGSLPAEAGRDVGPLEFQELGDSLVTEAAGGGGPLSEEAGRLSAKEGDSDEVAKKKAKRRQDIGRLIYAMSAGYGQWVSGGVPNIAPAAAAYDEALGIGEDELTPGQKLQYQMHQENLALRQAEFDRGGQMTPYQQFQADLAQASFDREGKQLDAATAGEAQLTAAMGAIAQGADVGQVIAAGAAAGMDGDALAKVAQLNSTIRKDPDKYQRQVDAVMAEAAGMGEPITEAEAMRRVATDLTKAQNEVNIMGDTAAKEVAKERVQRGNDYEDSLAAGVVTAARNKGTWQDAKGALGDMIAAGTEAGPLSSFADFGYGVAQQLGFGADVYKALIDNFDYDADAVRRLSPAEAASELAVVSGKMGDQGTISEGERVIARKEAIDRNKNAVDTLAMTSNFETYDAVDEAAYEYFTDLEKQYKAENPEGYDYENWREHQRIVTKKLRPNIAELARVRANAEVAGAVAGAVGGGRDPNSIAGISKYSDVLNGELSAFIPSFTDIAAAEAFSHLIPEIPGNPGMRLVAVGNKLYRAGPGGSLTEMEKRSE